MQDLRLRTIVGVLLLAGLANTSAYGQTIESAAPADGATGLLDGRSAANATSTGGWLAGGFASGLFFGLIGTGVVYAIAGSSEAELPPEYFPSVQAKGSAYMLGFNQGYVQRLKSKQKKAALIGGLTGTAISTAIVVALISSSDGDYDYYYSTVPIFQVSIGTR